MSSDWQTWAAAAVVVVTAVLYVRRLLGKRMQAGGCSSDCSCEQNEKSKSGD